MILNVKDFGYSVTEIFFSTNTYTVIIFTKLQVKKKKKGKHFKVS